MRLSLKSTLLLLVGYAVLVVALARVRVPAKWSVDRMLIEAVPPRPRSTS